MKTITSRKTVLVAVRHTGLKSICDALKPEFDLAVVHGFEEALSRLEGDISAIACGVHFDSGRMLDFLAYVKSNPRTQAIPFYVVLGSDRGYSEAIVDAIRIATSVLGADGFVDLCTFMDADERKQTCEDFRAGMRAPVQAEFVSDRAMSV